MLHSRFSRSAIVIVVASCTLSVVSDGSEALPRYKVVGTLNDARFVNNSGQVAGYAFGGAAAFWSQGSTTIINPAVAGASPLVGGLNDSGAVAGMMEFDGNASYGTTETHAFTWSDGATTKLPFLYAVPQGWYQSCYAYGPNCINNAGQVVGTSYVATGTEFGNHAVRWNGSAAQDLGWVSGGMLGRTINNYGGTILSDASNWYLCQDGVRTTLTGISSVTDLNDAGQLTGIAASVGGSVWQNGSVTKLADLLPGAGETSPQAINNHGDVVGHANVDSSVYGRSTIPVLWSGGQGNSLATIMDEHGILWDIAGTLRDINDHGVILANFVSNRTDPSCVSALLIPLLSGDANSDGLVNSMDFNIFLGNYGTLSGATWVMGDFDGDHKVTTTDFNLLAGHFGGSAPVPGAIVPEPASLVLLVGITSILRRRNHAH